VTSNGCLASRPLVINVSAPPTVDVGGSETVCFATNEVQLTGLPAGGTWSGNSIDSDGTFSPGFVNPGNTETVIYSVTVDGCTVSKTKQMTVSLNPGTVNAGPDQTICISEASFVLQGVVVSGGTWSGTGVSANGVFNPATAGVGNFTLTYTVTFFQSPGCAGTDTKVVSVISSPQAPNVQGDTICRQGIGTLLATGIAGSFNWFTTQTGGTAIAGQVSPSFTTPVLTTSTTYFVSQKVGTCESPRTPVLAFVNNFNNAGFIVAGLPPTLTANPSNGQSYQWMFAGNAIPGATQSTLLPGQNGDYSVIIRLDGCADTSQAQFVTVTDVTVNLKRPIWKVFPNPVQQDLFLEGDGIEEVKLLNVLGQTVFQSKRVTFQETINTDKMPNGVYWLELKGRQRVEKVKVVVKR